MSSIRVETETGATGPAGSSALQATLPTSALAQSLERFAATADVAFLTTATLGLVAVTLASGQTVSTITFRSAGTALDTGLNQWFALYSSARAKLGVTNDDTNVAWAANADKTLTLATPYVVTASGLYYVGIMVKATTPPSLRGFTSYTGATGKAPILEGSSTAALTNPASAPSTAAAITALGVVPYCYVS